MRVRVMSLFWATAADNPQWLASPIWAERDREWEVQEREQRWAELIDMGAWLRLSDAERAAVVGAYATARRPLGRDYQRPAAAAD